MEIIIALIILIVGIIVAIKISKRKNNVYEGEYCTPKISEIVEFGSVYFIKDGNCVVQECVEEYIPIGNKCVFDCRNYDNINSTSNIFIQKACFEECFNSEGSLLEENDVFQYDLESCGFEVDNEEEEEYETTLLDEVTAVELVDIKTLKGKIPTSQIGQVRVEINSLGNPLVTFTPDSTNWEYKFQSSLQPGIVNITYKGQQNSFSKNIRISSLQDAVRRQVTTHGRTIRGTIPFQYKGNVQVRVYDDPNWDWRNVNEEYNNAITPFTPTGLQWEYTLPDGSNGFYVYVSYTFDGDFFWSLSN